MTVTQSDKANRFRALHQGSLPFVMPNPWDIGSARVLSTLGFQALATSSGASAAVLGRRDGGISRDEALAHTRAIVLATDLPVSADLEKGFGDTPDAVAETIRLAADAGVVGGSIEDATGDKTRPLFDIGQAIERVAAAVEAARRLPFTFTLTARTENYLRGKPDLDSIRAVCAALSKPVNFMIGMKGSSFSVAELAAAGIRRISLGGALYRAAMTGFMNATQEIKDHGTFGFVERF